MNNAHHAWIIRSVVLDSGYNLCPILMCESLETEVIWRHHGDTMKRTETGLPCKLPENGIETAIRAPAFTAVRVIAACVLLMEPTSTTQIRGSVPTLTEVRYDHSRTHRPRPNLPHCIGIPLDSTDYRRPRSKSQYRSDQ